MPIELNKGKGCVKFRRIDGRELDVGHVGHISWIILLFVLKLLFSSFFSPQKCIFSANIGF